MKNKILLAFSALFFGNISAQTENADLEKNIKIEAGTRGFSFGYETPLYNNFLLDINIGYGFNNPLTDDAFAASDGWIQKYFSGMSPFAIAKVNYFISRKSRASKSRMLDNNAGSFFGIQTKYSPNNWDSELGQVLITQAHWGQNLPLSGSFSLNYHIGMGYATHLSSRLKKWDSWYPAIGVGIAYYLGN